MNRQTQIDILRSAFDVLTLVGRLVHHARTQSRPSRANCSANSGLSVRRGGFCVVECPARDGIRLYAQPLARAFMPCGHAVRSTI